ncbi:anaerobic C4-dicarboxylate transporter [Sulfurospirillum sp.]|uniref:anaerobic C4-dicarboxylate transporter n=1 Tax=Sulfurospirillum sp. TaxID=2053622 RepID=UPI002FDE7D38
MSSMFWIQLLVVLVILFFAARKSGIALGLIGGIGVIIFVFGFQLAPGHPPIDVMLVMLSVVCAGSALQASGGLDVMLQQAEKVLRKHPRYVTVLAPVTTIILTFLCGTGHVVYTLLPIIYDISIKTGNRPERAMAASTIAAQMGIMISPASVAVVSMIALMKGHPLVNGQDLSLIQLLQITMPSALIGVLVVGFVSMFRGKDLDKDPDFQELIKDPEAKKYVYGSTATLLGKEFTSRQYASVWLFLGTIAVIAILGMFPSLVPTFTIKGKLTPLSMVDAIQMFMLASAAVIYIVADLKTKAMVESDVFKAGMTAVIAVFGIAWMTHTMFGAHTADIKSSMGDLVKVYPWAYAVVLILISKLINSQAAAVSSMVPIALAVGVEPGMIAAFAAAAYGYWILPTYPSDIAALSFDRSGTTKIGKFVINHSFILPGFVGVTTACFCGFFFAKLYGLI